MADAQIANVEIEGDTATAFLRLRGCTLPQAATQFQQTANGQWRYDGPEPTSEGGARRCLE